MRLDDVAFYPAHRLRELDTTQRVWSAVVGILVVLCSAALVSYLARDGWTQVGDEANQIYGAQRAFVDWPLLGDLNTANYYGNPVSHHPGPMAFYVLAPFVLVLGPQLGAWIFATLWNSAWVAFSGWFAFRAGGARVAGTCIVAMFVAAAQGLKGNYASVFFQDLPLLPVLFCLVGAWVLARGDTLVLPFLVVAASFVVQAATLNLPLIAAASAAGGAVCAVGLCRGGRPLPRQVWIHLSVAAVLMAALWAPTLWDQVAGSGNLGLLLSAQVPHGWFPNLTTAVGAASMTLPVVEVAVVALTIAVLTVRHQPVVTIDGATAVVSVAVVAGAALTAMLIPADDVETTHWNWVPMVLAFLVVVGVGAVRLDDERAVLRGRLLSVLGLVVVLVTCSGIWPPSRWPERTNAVRATRSLDLALESFAPGAPIAIAPRGPNNATHVAQGLLPLVEDSGRQVGRSFSSNTIFDGFEGFGGYRLVVVTHNEPNDLQVGQVLAVHRPPLMDASLAGLPERVRSFVVAGGELRLAPHAAILLVGILDGLTPSFCVDELIDDPTQLLDEDPEVLTRMVALGLVESPALPDTVLYDARSWLTAQPVALIAVPPDEVVSAERVWSEDDC